MMVWMKINFLFVVVGAGIVNNANGATLLGSANNEEPIKDAATKDRTNNSWSTGLTTDATITAIIGSTYDAAEDSYSTDLSLISKIASASPTLNTSEAAPITGASEVAPISHNAGEPPTSNATSVGQVFVTTTLGLIIDPKTVKAQIGHSTRVKNQMNITTSSSTELTTVGTPSRNEALESLDRMERIMSEAEKLLSSEERMVSSPVHGLNSSDLGDFLLIQRMEQLRQRAQELELQLQNLHLENLLLRSNSGYNNRGLMPFEMTGGVPGNWRDDGYGHGRGRGHGGRRGHGRHGEHGRHRGHRRRGHGNGEETNGGWKEGLQTAATALGVVATAVKIGTMLAPLG